MFERILYDVLNESLARITGDSAVLDRFLSSLPLDEALGETDTVRELIKAFAAQERPVIHSYAREDTVFPVWSIVLQGEMETLRALGDESADDDEAGEPIKSSVFDSQYQVLVYSPHPDVTLYLYQLLRGILISRRHELIARAELLNLSTISGAELSPDRIWMPAFLFVRAVSITAQAEARGLTGLGGTSGEALPSTPSVSGGLHVLDPNAPADGIRHGVHPYTETYDP